MQAARGGNGLVCGCSQRIILEEFCILCKSFYVAGVEFLHVITRGNIQKWEAGVYSFRHKRNVYKKTKGYFFRCFTLISKGQSGFIFFPDKENTNVFLVLSFLGEAIKVQMYNFLPFRDQNTDGGDQCTLLLLHRANWCFPKQSSFQPALNSFTDPQNIAVYKVILISVPLFSTHFFKWWQKTKMLMLFLQRSGEIQMDTLAVKMAVKFQRIAQFCKNADDSVWRTKFCLTR